MAATTNVDLDLQLLGLEKVIDAGAGNDTVDLSGVIVDPADPTIFGGFGDDNIIGSPNIDLIYRRQRQRRPHRRAATTISAFTAKKGTTASAIRPAATP